MSPLLGRHKAVHESLSSTMETSPLPLTSVEHSLPYMLWVMQSERLDSGASSLPQSFEPINKLYISEAIIESVEKIVTVSVI